MDKNTETTHLGIRIKVAQLERLRALRDAVASKDGVGVDMSVSQIARMVIDHGLDGLELKYRP